MRDEMPLAQFVATWVVLLSFSLLALYLLGTGAWQALRALARVIA